MNTHLGRLAVAAERFRSRLFREPLASVLLVAGAALAFLYAGCALALRVWFEGNGPYNVDASIYWTVGNGIVHGLTPYKDLFETKPPGIFLLSALSYLLTGDARLTHATQVISLLSIALSPLVYARRLYRTPGNRLAAAPVFVALWALVLMLAWFVADFASSVQTEAHAMPGMVAYMLLVGVPGRAALAGRACGILLAIGMKEPFILSVPAVYLLLDPGTERPWTDLVAPIAIACLAGTAGLLAFGWLPAFFGIYLSAMAGGHINVFGSPWERVVPGILEAWKALGVHSPLLPLALLYLSGVYLFAPDTEAVAARAKKVALRFQALFVAVLLAGMAVGIGGHFYDHHNVFATPIHLAVVYALMDSLRRFPGTGHLMRAVLVAMVLLTAWAPAWVPVADLQKRLLIAHRDEASQRKAAKIIDTVLDRLGVERYLWLGHPGGSPMPFTKHQPMGPLFFQQVYFFEGKFPYLAAEFERQMHQAKVLVFFKHMTGPFDGRAEAILLAEYEPLPKRYIPKGSRFPYKLFVRRGTKVP